MGVVGRGTKGYEPWRATMELTKGRGPFLTVMTRVEVPSDMKQEREMDVRGLGPLESSFDHPL